MVSAINITYNWAELTAKGWEHYERLRLGQETSNNIFMAMAFVDEKCPSGLRSFYNHLKEKIPTRIELSFGNPLQDQGKAGLIHARMEVEIRQAKLVVVDLSHGNNGAYWEAGFATALGKPVIYTLNKEWWKGINETIKSTFNDNSIYRMLERKLHFDTVPHYHVEWTPNKLVEAEDNLVAAIRASLPGQVKSSD